MKWKPFTLCKGAITAYKISFGKRVKSFFKYMNNLYHGYPQNIEDDIQKGSRHKPFKPQPFDFPKGVPKLHKLSRKT